MLVFFLSAPITSGFKHLPAPGNQQIVHLFTSLLDLLVHLEISWCVCIWKEMQRNITGRLVLRLSMASVLDRHDLGLLLWSQVEENRVGQQIWKEHPSSWLLNMFSWKHTSCLHPFSSIGIGIAIPHSALDRRNLSLSLRKVPHAKQSSSRLPQCHAASKSIMLRPLSSHIFPCCAGETSRFILRSMQDIRFAWSSKAPGRDHLLGRHVKDSQQHQECSRLPKIQDIIIPGLQYQSMILCKRSMWAQWIRSVNDVPPSCFTSSRWPWTQSPWKE